MKKFCAKAMLAVLACSALVTATAADEGEHAGWKVRESVEVSDHYLFNTDTMVDGATILIRDFNNRIVRGTITSSALNPEAAYSIWIVVFNRPNHCAIANECGLGDLGNPNVEVSVFWGGGFIADSNGYANTAFSIVPGHTDRELFAVPGDYGLSNLKGAEIHIVLRTHGQAGFAGSVATQIGTANGACDGCENQFASVHVP